MTKLPKARTANIVVQNLRDETLIYDLTTNQAFCLNETSAVVFNYCDGKQTFANLKAEHNLTDEIIFLALDGLKKENLLETQYVSPFAGLSRREVIRKVGLASIIALSVISALVAPTSVMAQSSCRTVAQSCSMKQSDCCYDLRCDGGGCISCYPKDATFATCGGPKSSCQFICDNNQIFKNLCCNPGSSTLVDIPFGYNCNYP